MKLTELPHFRWMPRMRTTNGRTVLRYAGPDPDGLILLLTDDEGEADWTKPELSEPDTEDPATQGCLLALVIKAWGVGSIVGEMTDYSESYGDEGGRFEIRRGPVPLFRASGGTRVERLIRALEAAP